MSFNYFPRLLHLDADLLGYCLYSCEKRRDDKTNCLRGIPVQMNFFYYSSPPLSTAPSSWNFSCHGSLFLLESWMKFLETFSSSLSSQGECYGCRLSLYLLRSCGPGRLCTNAQDQCIQVDFASFTEATCSTLDWSFHVGVGIERGSIIHEKTRRKNHFRQLLLHDHLKLQRLLAAR